ncbi:tripartite tricarboxylate transporter substrate binding protein [Achromobacter veterisilvae]|uniref:Tripartite tricarboxylate transporter substrate binding protein n=1 Tax=Achromobacter veterisilvae TaxID=2069367 RepID=A0ABZ2RZQ1_9BURK|nr:tripartite tricarboxylate transporter substrate binding protein [Achromobacter sp.]MCW0207120.1 tripartite tricarboxylate transporter substrate binding protein [Achromobacter sp.]
MQNHPPTRRGALRKLAAFLALLPLAAAAPALAADNFPSKPIRLIVSYPPGGSNDIAARIIAPELGQALGASVVVENRAGASGVIGADHVAKSDPDGYTLLLSSISPIVLAPQTMKSPPFYAPKAFKAVNMMALTPEAIAVGPRLSGVKTLKELLDRAKTQQITLSSSGSGGLPHLTIELLRKVQGNILHVPYKGAGPAVTDTLGGHVDGIVMDLPPLYSLIKENRLTALAVTSEKRVDFLADVPTAQEFLPGFNVENWVGIFAPAGTPDAIVAKVDAALRHAVAQPKVKTALADAAMAPAVMDTPQDFQKRLADDYVRWGKVIQDAGVEMTN